MAQQGYGPQIHKERLYQRGIEVYMLTLPAFNVIGMRDGSEAKFGKGYNVLPIWKDRKSWEWASLRPEKGKRT